MYCSECVAPEPSNVSTSGSTMRCGKARSGWLWLPNRHVSASGIGTWRLTGWCGTRGCTSLYGIREQDFSGAYDAWLAGLHPEDLARGDAAITAAIDGVKDFNIEFRVVWPNGEVHDIEAHALVQTGPDGRATRMIGVNWDITERKRAMETIRIQADQYATMLSTTSDGFWILDRHGRFLAMNDAYCAMTGYSREELLKSDDQGCRGHRTDRGDQESHGNHRDRRL